MKMKDFDKKCPMTHFLLHSIDTDTAKAISEDIMKKTKDKEEYANHELDVKLIVEGREIDAQKTIDLLYSHMEEYIESTAKTMFSKIISDKVNNIIEKVTRISDICNSVENELDWKDTFDNFFKK
jgi:hypothetical protein